MPSLWAGIFLPRRAHSSTTKSIRPPSSMGIGRMFKMARLMLSKMPTPNQPYQPPSWVISPVTWAIPMGPENSGDDPSPIAPPRACLTNTSISQVLTKLLGMASQMGSDLFTISTSSRLGNTPTSHRSDSVSNLGRRCSSSSWLSRSTNISIWDPPFKLISRVKSNRFSISRPLALITTSPACTCDSDAAVFSRTSCMTRRPTATSWGIISRTVKISSGSMAFMNGPATKTRKRVPVPLPARLRGTLGLASPARRTKPPMGAQLTE